jgi:hypothetical protein
LQAAALKYPAIVEKLMVVDMAPSNLSSPSEKSFGEAARVGKALARDEMRRCIYTHFSHLKSASAQVFLRVFTFSLSFDAPA